VDDRNAPASKGDIYDLRSEIAGLSERLELLRSEMNHGYNDIVERIHDSQTALLKAFYGYGQANNKRVAELEGNEGAFRAGASSVLCKRPRFL
jgi:hypothetical protein